jgi:hypothetical protein
MFGLGIPELIVVLVLAFIVPGVFYLLTPQKATIT